MKRINLFLIFVLALTLVFAISCSNTSGGGSGLVLKSSAFSNNQRLDVKYCNTGVTGGQNISLPFNWENPPDGTASFALIIHDPQGGNWIHWAVFNIPASCNSIAENASGSTMPAGCVELLNEFGTNGYGGPEPPPGTGTHNYIATLYALNEASISGLSGPKNLAALNSLLSGKIIDSAKLTGTYSR